MCGRSPPPTLKGDKDCANKAEEKIRSKVPRFLYENCLLNRREQEKPG